MRKPAIMFNNYLWQALKWPGLEHLQLHSDGKAIHVDSLMIAQLNGDPLRIAYWIECDAQWRVRQARLELPMEDRRLALSSDGQGRWFDVEGRELKELEGCTDLDISATPFTNTLPIRRLGLKIGEKQAIRAAYIKVPEFHYCQVEQVYTCLATDEIGTKYRYESGAFKADLQMDRDGLVVEYLGFWRRANA